MLALGADFLVRVGWVSLRLTTPQGDPSDWEPICTGLAPGEATERRVVVTRHSRGPGRRSKPLFSARLVVMRQHATASERAMRVARRDHTRRQAGTTMQPLTLASAGYLMLLTLLPAKVATAAEVLATYRLRWQVELAFKWLKSGLGIDRLLARGKQSARSWLFAYLILALLIEDAAGEVLDAPPMHQVDPRYPVSLWRLHAAAQAVLLGAILRTVTLADLERAAALLVRHICNSPRRRPSQAANANRSAFTAASARFLGAPAST